MMNLNYKAIIKSIDGQFSSELISKKPKDRPATNALLKNILSEIAVQHGLICYSSAEKGRGEFMVDTCWIEKDAIGMIPVFKALHLACEIELAPHPDMNDMVKLMLMRSPLKMYVHAPYNYKGGANVLKFVRMVQLFDQRDDGEIYHFIEVTGDNRVSTTATFDNQNSILEIGVVNKLQVDSINRILNMVKTPSRHSMLAAAHLRTIPHNITVTVR